MQRKVGDRQRRQDRADIRAAVEDAGGEGALALREPIRHGADGSGEVRGLTQAEGKARDAKAQGGAGQRVRHGGGAPQRDGHRIAQARARPIDQAAGEGHGQRIGQLERENDPAVVPVAPAEFYFERRLEQREHLAIHVVDGGGEKQQSADVPAEPERGLAGEEDLRFHKAAYLL